MPTALVVVARFTPLALLVSSRAASGTTAPETSVTVPATLPRLVCGRAGKARLAIASRLIASLIRNLLLNFLSSRHDIHKEVSDRCLKVIEAVENERVVIRDSAFKNIHGECGSCTSSNPVVQRYVALSETPDVDPSAQRAEDCALGRGHCHVVVHDDGALHGPVCNLAKHTDAYGFCVRPPAIDRVVRNQIRTRVCDANRLGSRRFLRRHGTCGDHVPLHVHSSVNAPKVDRGLSRVLYLVPRNVRLDLRAWYPHAKHQYSYGVVLSRSSSKIDVVISDQERSGDTLWLSRVRWHRYTGARNDIDSLAA